jgi:hypothetical protein
VSEENGREVTKWQTNHSALSSCSPSLSRLEAIDKKLEQTCAAAGIPINP